LSRRFEYREKECRCNRASNGADRQRAVTLMCQQIKPLEGAPDVSGRV
jgi:hypothetical protein